jgi:hypothetical protein
MTQAANLGALGTNVNTSGNLASPTFTGQATIPTINLTGGQIAFPATQNPSSDPNTLDDYEEGTFTVSFIGDGGGSLVTLTTNTCTYTKIGNSVFFRISVDSSSALSGSTNTVRISGFPFTFSSTQYVTASIWLYGGFSFTTANGVMQTRSQVNTNTMYLQLTNQGAGANITNSYFSGGLNFMMTGHYIL